MRVLWNVELRLTESTDITACKLSVFQAVLSGWLIALYA